VCSADGSAEANNRVDYKRDVDLVKYVAVMRMSLESRDEVGTEAHESQEDTSDELKYEGSCDWMF
jgi:hypothetical protein